MPSSAAGSCPLCPRIVGLCLPVLAHSWHNGGLVVRRAVAFAWRPRLSAAKPRDSLTCGAKGTRTADHEGPYRVVVPGDTPPHSRAGGGNRRNAVLGFVALPATVIATVTAAAVTTGSTSSTTAPSQATLVVVWTVG